MYRFECTKCGDCCRWEGSVKLSQSDIDKASEFLGISKGDFTTKYTKLGDFGEAELKNKSSLEGSGRACVFLENNLCLIQEAKPTQCLDYPKKYDSRCPGFKKEEEEMAENTKREAADFDKAVVENLYETLRTGAKPSKVATINLNDETSGMDVFLDPRMSKIKIASLDDLFAFHREGNVLVHKSNKELWSIEKDSNGDIFIARHFDPSSGEPLKV